MILRGFSEETPPSELWRRLAARKLAVVERALAQAAAMKEFLEAGLRCECLNLEECLGQVEGGLDQGAAPAFGTLAVTAMVVMCGLEHRSPRFTIRFAGACLLSSAYGFLIGAWPFGFVEVIRAGVAVDRYRKLA